MPADPQSAGPVALDAATIISGIREFGLAADGSDLRDLESALLAQRQAREAAERDRDELRGWDKVWRDRVDQAEASLAKAEARIAEQDRANAHLQDNNSRMAEGWTKMQARIAELEAALRSFADDSVDVSGTAIIVGYPAARQAHEIARSALSSINKERDDDT